MLCVFCQNSFENEKIVKDFSFSFIFELLELSADCQSEINYIKESEIIKCNCVQCSSLLEKGHSILEEIKNLQKELSFVRQKLWTELSSSSSVSKSENKIRVILVRESRKALSKLNEDKYEIIIKTENEENENTENRDDNFIIPDLTISPESENSDEKLECKLNPNDFNIEPDYHDDDNNQIVDEEDNSSNTQFSYHSDEAEDINDDADESDEVYGSKKGKGKQKISKKTRKKFKKESKTDESEEEETEIPKRKRGKYRKNSDKKEPKKEAKRKRVKLDPNVEHFCEICQKTLSSSQKLRFHLKTAVHLNKLKEVLGKEIEIPLEECPVCKVFISPDAFRKHFKSNLHIKNEAEAPAELVKLLDEKWLNVPRNIPRQKIPRSKWKLKCEICEKTFRNTQKLESHKRTRIHLLKEKELTGKDNLEKYLVKCEICNLQCMSLENYYQHTKTERHLKNINETPDQRNERNCDICNTLFPSIKSKKKHFEKVHKIAKTPRDKESMASIRRELLKEGVKLKKTSKIYKKNENNEKDLCEICGQNFADKNKLNTHIKSVHEKVIKYFCKFCPYKSYFRYQVNDHTKRVHSNKRDYICHICGKGYKSNSCLNSHKYRTHSEPRFKCPELDCGKVFRNRQNYKAHLSTHSSELKDSVKCDICDKTYSHKLALYHHKNKTHKDQKNVKQNINVIVDNVDDLI